MFERTGIWNLVRDCDVEPLSEAALARDPSGRNLAGCDSHVLATARPVFALCRVQTSHCGGDACSCEMGR